MTRLLDLFAVLLVAFLVLLPQPSVTVYPAVQGDKTDLDRLAVLEDALYRAPDDATTAIELSRAYLRIEQPAWAVAVLAPFLGRGNYQVHQVAAYAYATLLQPEAALRQTEEGLKACEAAGAGCPDVARIRLGYLADLMRQPAQNGIDPRTQPLAARQMVQAALRATKAPMPAPQKGAARPVAPATPSPAPTPAAPGAAPAPAQPAPNAH